MMALILVISFFGALGVLAASDEGTPYGYDEYIIACGKGEWER